jgi:endonuclease/exonuclease/phosphatase family metal-dependent hydrolase
MLQEAVRSDGVPAAIPPGAAAAGWIGSAESIEHGAIDRLARTLGMSVFYAPSMRNGGQSARLPADRGNAILSTLPLFDPSAIEIPGDGQRRVAVAATVRVAAGGADTPLRIATAHLDTLGAARTLWLFGAPAAREAQARALDAALPAGPLVLGADLNSWLGPGEPAARRLLASFPSTPGGRREPTFMAGMVLDYLFFRPPAGWRAHFERVPARYGSDHYPLVGWLTRTADR